MSKLMTSDNIWSLQESLYTYLTCTTRDTPTSCGHNLVENTTSLSERNNFKTK